MKFISILLIGITILQTSADARYYDATEGRFISPDPIVPSATDPQSLNRYAYGRNNPVVLTDPSGHSWLSHEIKKINHWADHNPVGSILIGAACPTIGVPLMDRTSTGRDALAGAIVVATIIGTAGAATPAWTAAGWGALSGEVVGGYSAYRSHGSILSGVGVGGAVGAGTGYLGYGAGTATQGALGSTRVAYIAGGAARGAIIGAGVGGVAGYRGGRGNFDSEWAGVYRGAAVGGVLGGAMGYFEYPGGPQPPKSPQEALSIAKEDVMRGAQDAAQSHSANPLGNIAARVAGDFGARGLNAFAENYAPAAYGAVSTASGFEEIYHSEVEDYLEEHGISGSTKIQF